MQAGRTGERRARDAGGKAGREGADGRDGGYRVAETAGAGAAGVPVGTAASARTRLVRPRTTRRLPAGSGAAHRHADTGGAKRRPVGWGTQLFRSTGTDVSDSVVISRQDPRPAYRQVADAIRADIEAERLRPGHRIPSLAQIEREYGVTSATAQRAIGYLRDEGLVETRHGSGSFVRRERPWIAVSSSWMRPPPDGQPDFWTTQAAEHGFAGTQRLVFVGTVVPPERVRDSLDLEEGETVVLRDRVMMLDEVPVQIVRSYYPHDVADGTPLASPKKIKGGSPAVVATLPDPPVEILETVIARQPSEEERKVLDLSPATPVVELFRNAITAGGRPIDAVVMILVADRHRLMYRMPI